MVEEIDASPLIAFTDAAAGWAMIVDGREVRVQLSLAPDESATHLEITWD